MSRVWGIGDRVMSGRGENSRGAVKDRKAQERREKRQEKLARKRAKKKANGKANA